MIIKNVMTKDPVTILQDASVTEAKALMVKKGISKLPVVDSSNKLVGIITDKDLDKASPSDATTLDMFEISYLLSKLNVKKIMKQDVFKVDEEEVIEEAARIMVRNNIGCLPVMKGNVLTGIITEGDLFRIFTEIFGSHNSGVRAVVLMDDKPGVLLNVAQKIAGLKGNIVSLVTQEQEEASKRKVTVKVSGVSLDQLKAVLDEEKVAVIDIREA